MHVMVGVLVLLFSFASFGQTKLLAKIHDLEISNVPGEPTLIFLSTGLVAKWNLNHDTKVLTEGKSQDQWFEWNLNKNREVVSYHPMSPPKREPNFKNSEIAEAYTPTIIPSLEEAKLLFHSFRVPREGETQCFNRAQVWAFEWRKEKNVYSEKAWIFFTKKYIRKYNFEWWFHVAPMVRVAIDGKVKTRVMDMKYARGPIPLNSWTNIFMKDDADCPVVERHADHANFPESGTCFVQTSSMYYYQPIDLENLDQYGSEKTGWMPSEVIEAYREAFAIGAKNEN